MPGWISLGMLEDLHVQGELTLWVIPIQWYPWAPEMLFDFPCCVWSALIILAVILTIRLLRYSKIHRTFSPSKSIGSLSEKEKVCVHRYFLRIFFRHLRRCTIPCASDTSSRPRSRHVRCMSEAHILVATRWVGQSGNSVSEVGEIA